NIGPAAQSAVPILRKLLHDTGQFSLGNRVFSAKALWQITGKTNEALPVLINALKNDDSFWAADVLGMMGADAKPAIPALQGALQSPIGYTRLLSAIALNKIEPQFQLPMPLLLGLLKDQSSATRFEAAQIIWTMNHDPQIILPTLLELIKPDDQGAFGLDFYGENAISLLGEIGPPAKAAIPRLKEIIQENRSSHISNLAADALKKIRSNAIQTDAAPNPDEQFAQVLNSTPLQVHIKARFIEVPKKTLTALRIISETTNDALEILNLGKTDELLQRLSNEPDVEILAEPEAVTLSRREVRMLSTQIINVVTNFALRETGINSAVVPETETLEVGPVFDTIATVLSDGYTIDLKPTASSTEFLGYAAPTNLSARFATNSAGEKMTLPTALPAVEISRASAHVKLYDGQTLVLFPKPEQMAFSKPDQQRDARVAEHIRQIEKRDGNKSVIVLVTVTLVDPSGHRIHSDDELPFAKDAIPPQ
ncbi:MAG: hypothetical protein WBW41_01510, partial [Verrucomicrobiia bacterium]